MINVSIRNIGNAMDLSWEAKPISLFIVSLLLLSLFPFLILPGNNEATASQHRLSIVSETGESRIAYFTSGAPSQSLDAQWKGHLCLSGKTPGKDYQIVSEKKHRPCQVATWSVSSATAGGENQQPQRG